MTAEIICVGTEILLGDIINTNAQFLGQQLASLGIPHYFQSVVGDNRERLKQVLAIAEGRSQIILFTGGLGPTPDDLTTETIADFFDVPLEERPDVLADIEAKFARRGRQMQPNNRKQALLPVGAQVLYNPSGSAPGLIWQPRPNLTLLTFPGVPAEMRRMWHETAVPYLKSLGWGKEIIFSRTLRFWGIGESSLAAKVAPFFDLENPTVAPYASKGQVKLRISVKAGDESQARAAIAPVEQQLREIAGLDCFGADEDTLASVVGRLLLERQETVAVAESCTGGGLGAMITSVSGSSRYFLGGIIAYDNRIKTQLLGVDAKAIEGEGAVSATVAAQMAKGSKQVLAADWGIAITGVAGPTGGSEEKPVGSVYLGIAAADGSVETHALRLGAERDRSFIQYSSICHALDRLRRQLI